MVLPTYTGPAHPIGYVEVQSSWVGEKTSDEMRELIETIRADGLRGNPGYRLHGSRFEETRDGAGVRHYTLYVGFAPVHVAAEPLDPHNLNNAPTPQPGWPEPTDGIEPVGYREAQFNRGGVS